MAPVNPETGRLGMHQDWEGWARGGCSQSQCQAWTAKHPIGVANGLVGPNLVATHPQLSACNGTNHDKLLRRGMQAWVRQSKQVGAAPATSRPSGPVQSPSSAPQRSAKPRSAPRINASHLRLFQHPACSSPARSRSQAHCSVLYFHDPMTGTSPPILHLHITCPPPGLRHKDASPIPFPPFNCPDIPQNR